MADVHNERTKLTATALNNLGVASIVTGAIGPAVAYLFGTVREDNPLRVAAIIVAWLTAGVMLIGFARNTLKGLR